MNKEELIEYWLHRLVELNKLVIINKEKADSCEPTTSDRWYFEKKADDMEERAKLIEEFVQNLKDLKP